jgi:hypothetical protein
MQEKPLTRPMQIAHANKAGQYLERAAEMVG